MWHLQAMQENDIDNRMVAAQAISVKGWYKSSNDQTTSLFSLKNSHSPFEKSPWILQTWIKSI